MGRLEGKVAIVTGARRGIGAEHALLLASEGASVVVNDIGGSDADDAASVVAQIESHGGTAVASTTSATWDGAQEIVASALDTFGRVDVLVNNATFGRNNDLWRYSEADWDHTVDVNLKGYFAMVAAVVEPMARQGGGSIVNTSSGSGFGHPSYAAYSAAKEGLIGLTRSAAMELGRFGIRCNAIRPAATSEQFHEYQVFAAPWKPLMDATMGTGAARSDPDEIAPRKVAPFVVWLCTDAAIDVNGCSFRVAGDRISLLSLPMPTATIEQAGGWTLDGLDSTAPTDLLKGVTNAYTLDAHPDLQVFGQTEQG